MHLRERRGEGREKEERAREERKRRGGERKRCLSLVFSELTTY